MAERLFAKEELRRLGCDLTVDEFDTVLRVAHQLLRSDWSRYKICLHMDTRDPFCDLVRDLADCPALYNFFIFRRFSSLRNKARASLSQSERDRLLALNRERSA